jgi:hypothetical protein
MNVTRNRTTFNDSEATKDDVLETARQVLDGIDSGGEAEVKRGWSDNPFVTNGLNEISVTVDAEGNIVAEYENVVSDAAKELQREFQSFGASNPRESRNPQAQDDRSHADVDRTKYTKEEAKYLQPHENSTPNKCVNCAHYNEAGGCKVVEGSVDPKAVCRDLYSDVGMFFGLDERGQVEVNLVMWGEEADVRVTANTIPQAMRKMENKLEEIFN